MAGRYDTEEQEERKYTIARECRRMSYEKLVGQETICSRPEEGCLYRAERPGKTGRYQCMNIEKKDLWKHHTAENVENLESKLQ